MDVYCEKSIKNNSSEGIAQKATKIRQTKGSRFAGDKIERM